MEELTGRTASYMPPAAPMFGALQRYIAAGDLITMDKLSEVLEFGLAGNHCYMFDKILGSGASASVQLLNRWGVGQPAAILLTRLAQSGVVEIDFGHLG